jgi:hypothetical protein
MSIKLNMDWKDFRLICRYTFPLDHLEVFDVCCALLDGSRSCAESTCPLIDREEEDAKA